MGLEDKLNAICGSNFMLDIYSILSENLLSGSGKFSVIYNFSRTLYNAVMPLGVYLLFIYFLASVVERCTADQFSWEQFFKLLIMLVMSKYIMENGFDILTKLFGAGQAIMSYVSRAGTISGGTIAIDAEAIVNSMRESTGFTGFLKAIGDVIIWVELLIPSLISWVIKISVHVICYSRMIEIYLRLMYAPVALSDFFANGLNGTGWRYLKGFLAVSLHGAMILGIGIIYSALFSTLAYTEGTDVMTFCIPVIAIGASCVMLMFRSQSLAKEIVGVA